MPVDDLDVDDPNVDAKENKAGTEQNEQTSGLVSNAVSEGDEQKLVATEQNIKEVIVVYNDNKAIKYEIPEKFHKNNTIGTIIWTPTTNSAGDGSDANAAEGEAATGFGGSKRGVKKSRKPKSKRIRVRKTRRRKH